MYIGHYVCNLHISGVAGKGKSRGETIQGNISNCSFFKFWSVAKLSENLFVGENFLFKNA